MADSSFNRFRARWRAGRAFNRVRNRVLGVESYLLPPSGNWFLKLLFSETCYLEPSEGPEEKEDDKSQKHSDWGQQYPQETELQKGRRKSPLGLGRAHSTASISY